MTIDITDLLATPYAFDGVQVGVSLGCFGTVCEVARRLGLPAPTGWVEILAKARAGSPELASGFPAGWQRMPDGTRPQNGDVVLFTHRDHPGCAILLDGYMVTASPERGPHRVQADRWSLRTDELWRHVA